MKSFKFRHQQLLAKKERSKFLQHLRVFPHSINPTLNVHLTIAQLGRFLLSRIFLLQNRTTSRSSHLGLLYRRIVIAKSLRRKACTTFSGKWNRNNRTRKEIRYYLWLPWIKKGWVDSPLWIAIRPKGDSKNVVSNLLCPIQCNLATWSINHILQNKTQYLDSASAPNKPPITINAFQV